MNTNYREISKPMLPHALAAAMLACLLWLTAGAALAQEAQAAQPAVASQAPTELTLTPAQAAELALRNSLQLQRDAKSVEQAEARLKQAQTIGKTTTAASASLTHRAPVKNSRPFNEILSVALNKPLYTGHRLETQTALAKRGIEAASARAAVTASETALAARTLAYNILRLDMLASVTNQRATAVAEHLRITRAMEAAGTVPNFEVVQAETELASAKGDIIAAQTAAQQARAVLANLLVLPQTTVLTVEEGVPLQQPDASLTDLFALGWEERPEMTLADRQLRVAEATLDVIHQSTNSSLGFVAQVNQQTVTAVNEPLNWVLGLAWTKPLSDGGMRRAEEEEQRAVIADAKLQIESLKQDISLEIKHAVLAVDEAREQLKVAEAGEVNARERLRMADVRFAAGLSIGIEVLDAQTALAAAQAATVNARYDLQTSVVDLLRAIGDLEEDLEAGPAAPAKP
ncbi:MAG: TolC family protein [Armatimonadia bacterium]